MIQTGGVHFKVAVGYVVFVVVLLLSLWLVYDNTRSLIAVDNASEAYVHRRNVADSLVYSLLEVDNAERSLCLGSFDDRPRFDRSLRHAVTMAKHLKQLMDSEEQRTKIDSLLILLVQKRDNLDLIMGDMAANRRDAYYDKKLEDLHRGKDSVVIHPKTAGVRERKETVYEVLKTKKSFFGRLADAFRGQRNDTVSMESRSTHSESDTVAHRIDIANDVADVLTQIQIEEQKASRARRESIRERNRQLQMVSVSLARRTEQLLNTIRRSEQVSLQSALDAEYDARMAIIFKIMTLAVMAVFSAIVLMLNVSRDIRRAKEYSENLQRAKDEAERMMQQRERLLLTITHDIKAPAASISGFIELLADYVHDPKGRSYLDNVRSSATHLLHLVSALLDYHQLEKGKVRPRPVSFSPARLVESSVAERQPQAAAKSLYLRCKADPSCAAMCKADAFRIKQILDNLISNALKYTDDGGVEVACSLGDGRLKLSVADTGQGMTPDEMTRIYNAFTRLPGAQGIEGVGLGLSITREVVAMLGGTIDVESEKHRGSVFAVVLPIAVCEEAPAESSVASVKVSHSNKVFIVDDDKLQLRLLQEMFARLSGMTWDVRVFSHADEALAAVAEEKPGLMMVDVEMPEMSGTEMVGRLDHDSIRVVAMTAHEPSIEPSLLEAGFCACLFKPFSGDALASLMSRLTNTSVEYAFADDKRQSGPFAPLLAFAEGDAASEREILANFKAEISQARDAVVSASVRDDHEAVARVAHKLQPTFAMIDSPAVDTLQKLSPEHIGELPAQDFRSECLALVSEINRLVDLIGR